MSLDTDQVRRAALVCQAVNTHAHDREIDPGPLSKADVRNVQRLPITDKYAKQRLGTTLGSIVAWLVSVMPFARAYIITTAYEQMVVFKGTAKYEPGMTKSVPLEFEGRAGWMLNMNMGLSHKVQDALSEAGYPYPGLVHGGFAALLSSYDLESLRRSCRTAPGGIVIVGHSQGGAVATLAASTLARN